MAVKIRLQRMGGKRKPFYRFVVMDSRNRRDGAYLDSLGNYNPIAKPFKIEVDEEKVFMWLGRGAQLSEGARSILSKVGVLKKWEAHKSGQAVPEAPAPAAAVPEAAAPAAAIPVTPAPEAVAPEAPAPEAAAPEAAAPEAAAPEAAAPETAAPESAAPKAEESGEEAAETKE